MNPELLNRVKRILGIEWDIDKDEILNEFIANSTQMVNLYCGTDILPEELEFIVIENVIARFNRMGSEGYESENFDTISINYLENLLTPYYPYMDSYRANNKKVRFL